MSRVVSSPRWFLATILTLAAWMFEVSVPTGAAQTSAAQTSAAQTPSRDTSASPNDQIERVSSLSDLKPRTSSEEARATQLDRRYPQKLADSPDGGERIVSTTLGPGVSQVPDIVKTVDGVSIPTFPSQTNEADALTRQICSAETSLVGRAVSRRTLLSSSESWLITDYRISVDRWLHGGTKNTEIVVSDPNGEVDVAGRIYRTRTSGRPLPLLKIGQAYVIGLVALAGNDGYQFSFPPIVVDLTGSPAGGTGSSMNDASTLGKLSRAAASCTRI